MVRIASKKLPHFEKFVQLHYTQLRQVKNVLNVAARKFSTHFKGSTEVMLSNEQAIEFSTGEYARLADAAIVTSLHNTSVMAIVVKSKEEEHSSSMLPLQVFYRQKASATGRIPVNYIRREVGQTPQEMLYSRVIDRSIRALFPDGYNFETQVTCNLLATDGVIDPAILAINAASAALSMSSIPWNGPVGAVRVGLTKEMKTIINPTKFELKDSLMNLVVTGNEKSDLVMLEGSANEVPSAIIQKSIEVALQECCILTEAIKSLQKQFGKQKQTFMNENSTNLADLEKFMTNYMTDKINEILSNHNLDKVQRDEAVQEVLSNMISDLKTYNLDHHTSEVSQIYNKLFTKIFQEYVLTHELRCDGRKFNQLRDISCGVNLFEPLHGSSIFRRGQTQVLCTVTLDSKQSALKIDPVTMAHSDMRVKNFFLHYEFPPYATNEIGKVGLVRRREIGHGALAEIGLKPILPADYPLTIRVNCEVLESNGSSSMASVCAGSLALMNACVPVKTMSAGVAIGLVTERETTGKIKNYKILTDILGIEDYCGQMDFKAAGTKNGFTAFQLDLKIPGIPLAIFNNILHAGEGAIHDILEIMKDAVATPPQPRKSNLPVVENIEVPLHMRSQFVGPGGLNITKIFLETGVQIHQETETEYSIFAPNKQAMEEAKAMMEPLLVKNFESALEFGGIYSAKIVEIRDSGVMVVLYPGMKPVLLHNSQLDQRIVAHPSALGITIGQEINVKYFGRDPSTGVMRLSRKVLQTVSGGAKNLVS